MHGAIYPHFPTVLLLQKNSFTLKHTLLITSYIWEWFIIEINVNFATYFFYQSGIFKKKINVHFVNIFSSAGWCVCVWNVYIRYPTPYYILSTEWCHCSDGRALCYSLLVACFTVWQTLRKRFLNAAWCIFKIKLHFAINLLKYSMIFHIFVYFVTIFLDAERLCCLK